MFDESLIHLKNFDKTGYFVDQIKKSNNNWFDTSLLKIRNIHVDSNILKYNYINYLRETKINLQSFIFNILKMNLVM